MSYRPVTLASFTSKTTGAKMDRTYRNIPPGARRTSHVPNTRSPEPQPGETLIELLTRDLEAWRLAKGVIAKASARS